VNVCEQVVALLSQGKRNGVEWTHVCMAPQTMAQMQDEARELRLGMPPGDIDGLRVMGVDVRLHADPECEVGSVHAFTDDDCPVCR
jgi:hypothetical protein